MKTLRQLSFAVVALAVALGINYASAAWSNPSTIPPNGNIDVPVNVGVTTQTRTGDLFISQNLTVGKNIVSSLQITSPKYCIGTSCITAWPGAGSTPTLDTVTAGTGNATTHSITVGNLTATTVSGNLASYNNLPSGAFAGYGLVTPLIPSYLSPHCHVTAGPFFCPAVNTAGCPSGWTLQQLGGPDGNGVIYYSCRKN